MIINPEMTASALIALLKSFESAEIPIWLDGGWGVDALLQTKTRSLKDVDIVIALSNVPRLRELLTRKGFTVQEGKPLDSFVMTDKTGLAVDIHAVRYDEAGNGSALSNVALVTRLLDTAPPATPTGVAANLQGGGVHVQWNPNGEPDLAGSAPAETSR